MSHQTGRYKAHLLLCTKFKTNNADVHRKLTAAEGRSSPGCDSAKRRTRHESKHTIGS